VLVLRKNFPTPSRDREFEVRELWRREEDGSYLWCLEDMGNEADDGDEGESMPHMDSNDGSSDANNSSSNDLEAQNKTPSRGPRGGAMLTRGKSVKGAIQSVVSAMHHDDCVKGSLHAYLKVTKMPKGSGGLRLEYCVKYDYKGHTPHMVLNAKVMGVLGYLRATRDIALQQRQLAQYDGEDGRALGEAAMAPEKEQMGRHWWQRWVHRWESMLGIHESASDLHLRLLFESHEGLAAVSAAHEFFGPLVRRVVRNKLRNKKEVATALDALEAAEGEAIGASFAVSLVFNLTPEAAVYEWIGNYPSLTEFSSQYVWFKPMMETIAKRLLEQVSWGLKARVTVGAGLSILDLVSDLYVVISYSSSETTAGYGRSLMVMVGFCIFLQILIAIGQNWKKPKACAFEVAIVLAGAKPGWDAYKVASGTEMEAHQIAVPFAEMSGNKLVELFAEGIP
jgi:hypothetical protein